MVPTVTAADVVHHYIVKATSKENRIWRPRLYLRQRGDIQISKHEQLRDSWVWVIDPLDGIWDFVKEQVNIRIHIALVKDGQPILAVIAQPEAEKLYCMPESA